MERDSTYYGSRSIRANNVIHPGGFKTEDHPEDEQSPKQFRIHLGLDQLPLVLFHREADARYIDFLETFFGRGWIQQLGVSCGTDAKPGRSLVGDSRVRAMQIPFNILDRRHEVSGLLERDQQCGMQVYARSAFLQGLLAVPEEYIPPYCREVIPAHRHLVSLAREHGMSLAELALRFVLPIPGINHALIGVDTMAQLQKNLRMAAGASLGQAGFNPLARCEWIIPKLFINEQMQFACIIILATGILTKTLLGLIAIKKLQKLYCKIHSP